MKLCKPSLESMQKKLQVWNPWNQLCKNLQKEIVFLRDYMKSIMQLFHYFAIKPGYFLSNFLFNFLSNFSSNFLSASFVGWQVKSFYARAKPEIVSKVYISIYKYILLILLRQILPFLLLLSVPGVKLKLFQNSNSLSFSFSWN